MSLDAFFGAMAPMLEGTQPASSVIEALGPTPSGAENLGFYATLVERNHFKILADVGGPLRDLLEREVPGWWARLVRGFRAAHPATHWDPNLFAAGFSDYIRAQRDDGAPLHPIFEELADLAYVRQRAFSCNAFDGDGYEQRVFVRQYMHPASDYMFELNDEPSTPLPEARPQVVIVYQHATDLSLHHFSPNAAGLAAIALRQGITQLPAMFGALTDEAIAAADRALIEHGVVLPKDQPR